MNQNCKPTRMTFTHVVSTAVRLSNFPAPVYGPFIGSAPASCHRSHVRCLLL
jgi:hypothetical protein